MMMKESVLQTKCIKYAKKELPSISISRSSTEGFPDRTFFWNGRVFCVEFKAKGKKPSPLQVEKHRELYRSGIYTFVIDDYDHFSMALSIFTSDNFLFIPKEFYDKCCYYDKVAETFDL